MTREKAGTHHELARALGVTRQTIINWSRRGAPGLGADRLYDVEEWREWSKKNNDRKKVEPDLKDELLREQIRRLRLANDAVEQRQVPLAEVFNAIRPTLAAFRQSLDALPHRAAMKIGGDYHDVVAILETEVGITLRRFVNAPWFDEESTVIPSAEVAVDLPEVAVPNEAPKKKPRGRPPKKK